MVGPSFLLGCVYSVKFTNFAPEHPAEPRQTKSRQRVEILSRLKEVIKERQSWDDVQRMTEELEGLI